MWLLPTAAGSFWAGILSRSGPMASPTPGLLVVVGLALLLVSATLAHTESAPDQQRRARSPPYVPALLVCLAFVLLGAGWSGIRDTVVRSSYLATHAGAVVGVDASLLSDPEPGSFGWTATAGVSGLRLDPWTASTNLDVAGSVWLEASTDPADMRRGDRIVATGLLLRPPPDAFGEFLAHRGIAAVLEARRVRRVGPPTNPLSRAAGRVREVLLERIRRLFAPRDAGLLMGLALGDTSGLDPADERHFRATGLGHLLAVSGENVAMVLGPVLALAVMLRLSAAARFAVGGVTVVFFVALTGGEPSVLRAGVMAEIALFGTFLGRPRSTAGILGAAVLGLLVFQPTLVWSLGFQLSVAATAGIVALGGPLAARMRRVPRIPHPLALAFATTLAAQLGVSPLLLFHFHEVPGSTLAANLLAFPVVAPGLLLGLAAATVAPVMPPVAGALAFLAAVPLRYLEGLADRLASAPIPWITSSGGIPELLLGGAAVVLLTIWLRSGRPLPRRALTVAAVVVPIFVWAGALSAGPPAGLEVRFFDVGQGDAALVSSPDGANVLIDGGPDPELVARKLSALGVKRLDAIVATHPHEDHYIGLPAVLARFPVGLVVDSGCDPPESRSASYLAFLRAVRQEGAPERHPMAGGSFLVGDLRFDVLSPDRCWRGTHSDPNNDSLVLRLSYREDIVLFANEPEADAQAQMLRVGAPLTAAVLNVPHHGAGTSIRPFFEAVHEQVAIVSVGPNDYGHPVPRTLEWLRGTGARVLRTDHVGDVVIAFTSSGMRVDTEHGRDLLIQSAA